MPDPDDTDVPPPPRPRVNGRAWPTATLTSAPSTTNNPAPAQSQSQADGDRWTVGRLLSWTTDYLKKHGSESPRLDAEVLLARALGWQRVQLYTQYEGDVAAKPRAEFRELVRRRAEGMPVAYLVGRKEFYSLALTVGPAVLIPRPDSEFVVVEFLAAFGPGSGAVRGVDVGTGSGCLALACAHEHKASTWVAIDVSPEALAVAAENAHSLGLADRVEFRCGDRLGPVAGEGPFDVIVSNPPYIPSATIATLEPGVRDFEPHLALDGGEDGLRVVAPLIAEAVPLLKPGGHLILEIGSDQEEAVRSLLSSQPLLQLAPTVRDHANHPRVVCATRVR